MYKNGVDAVWNHRKMVRFVAMFGWDEFLKYLRKQFPHHDVYAVSQSWYYDGSEYILKARGKNGDVIVSWER